MQEREYSMVQKGEVIYKWSASRFRQAQHASERCLKVMVKLPLID